MTGNRLRVAILGGGLAGATLIQVLLKNSNLDVHIFESAPAFREAGNAIGFGQNAITALEMMGLRDRLASAQPVQTKGTKVVIAQGKDSGKIGFSDDRAGNTVWSVQRSLFLGEMLKDIDKSRLHPSKKMKSLTQQPEDILLEFEDGSNHTCDILIGADGIYSAVRKYIVGPEDPSASPTFAGWQTVWTIVPYAAAEHHLGKDLINPENPFQYAWCGQGTFMLLSQVSNHTMVNCVLTRYFDEEHQLQNQSKNRKTNKTELYDFVKGFDQPIGKAMVDLLTEGKEDFEMFPLQHHNPQAPRYVKDRVAIMGDAADATTPWRGSGGAMSLEDAFILGNCFEKVSSISDAKAALKAYESIRRPRRSHLVMESYRAGLILSGCDTVVALDSQKMSDTLTESWNWILNIDLKQHAQSALEVMEAEKRTGSSEE